MGTSHRARDIPRTEVVLMPKGGGRRHGGKTERDRLIEAEAILRDRGLGLTQSQLMDKYGMSRVTVQRKINEALASCIATTVDMYRAQVNDTLDLVMTRLAENLDIADGMIALGRVQENIALIDRGARLRLETVKSINHTLGQRSRLNGLDAPVKVEMTTTEANPADSTLAEMIKKAKMKAAEENTDGQTIKGETVDERV